MNINQRIKIEMTSRGWTVYKLSKITGISKSAINGWFKEIPTAPNYKSIRLVAKAFNMKAEDLVSEKRCRPSKTRNVGVMESFGNSRKRYRHRRYENDYRT